MNRYAKEESELMIDHGFVLAEVVDLRSTDAKLVQFNSCSLNTRAWKSDYGKNGMWWAFIYLDLVLSA